MEKEQWKEVIVINSMDNVNAELEEMVHGLVADAKSPLLVSFKIS